MNRQHFCYFDNNATTRVAPEVVAALLPYLTDYWGNPSSAYDFGHQLARPLDEARASVAQLIHAERSELVFTSCGTEGTNMAIHSALATQPGRRHIVTTAVEHSATLKYCRALEQRGCRLTVVPVNADGALDLALLAESIRSDTAIVSVMWANNETGMLFPIQEIAGMCRRNGSLFHSDAVQAAGKIEMDVRQADVDFLSLSGHKLHAPKGVGVLYIKRRTKFEPLLIGGGQERGRRAGTENVAGAVAFGEAARLAAAQPPETRMRIRALRDKLETGIMSRIPGTARNGAAEPRLPNTSNLSFEGVEAEGILLLLDQAGICASSGSACAAGALDPSHVLTAMGFNAERVRGSIRFSLGQYNTDSEIDYLLETLPGIIAKLRAHTPAVEPMTPAV